MDIKKNIEEVKKELTADEQMLASAFKIEKFYKKHKVKIIALVSAILIFVIGTQILEAIERSKLESANSAYLTLLKNPNDKEAKETLKSKNPKLFELYSYSQAVKNRDTKTLKDIQNSSDEILKDTSSYHLGVLEKKEVNSKFYNDFAILYNSYLAIKSNNIEEAKNQLALIDQNSPLYNISQVIKHYTIKGK
jgi:hypothetical protein